MDVLYAFIGLWLCSVALHIQWQWH